MPSQIQSGNEKDYPTEIDRQVAEWDDEWLLRHIPMTKEVALNFHNAAHRQDASEQVKEHFKKQMEPFKEQ